MEYKKLGRTNLNISRIAFGCYPMGAWDWGKVSDQDSIAAVCKAIRGGVNLFDTADIYGLGHSEEILSKALGRHKKNVVIATKVGLKWDFVKKKSQRDLSPSHIIKSIESSLTRLKIDCIPLYQIHYFDSKTPIYRTAQILKKLQQDGKFKYLGVSNFSLKLISEFQKYVRIEAVQLPYNLLNQSAVDSFYSACKKNKISILSYGSLAQGFLSGKYGIDSVFNKDDHRSRDENFKGRRLLANLEIVDNLNKIGSKYGKSCSQLALNWILYNTHISSAIVGMKTAEQVGENINLLGWKIAKQDYDELTASTGRIYKKYGLLKRKI